LEHFRAAASSCRLRIAAEAARSAAANLQQPTPEAQALGQILKDIEERIEEEELVVPIPEEELSGLDPQAPMKGVASEEEEAFEEVVPVSTRKRERSADKDPDAKEDSEVDVENPTKMTRTA